MGARDARSAMFRNAMARMSAAVSVVSSDGVGGRCGITATAVCSVTDAPPTLLICLNRSSALNAVFKANGRLCVNVLSADHEGLARDFAGLTGVPMADRFAVDDWVSSHLGLPILQSALATFQGEIVRADEVGSHTVMLVEALDIGVHPGGRGGLVYFDRLFHRVSSV